MALKTIPFYDDYKHALPANIFAEHEKAKAYKDSLGENGLFEQARINELYMLGQHWEGIDIGDVAPKPVTNVIKQIIDYKISNIVSNPIDAMFSFEGVPYNVAEEMRGNPEEIMGAVEGDGEQKINAIADAITAHFKTIMERSQMDKMMQTGVRKAAISGSMILYLPYNPKARTGLTSPDGKKKIVGAIEPELLNVANVDFGNPAQLDVQKQPYIIVSQMLEIRDIVRIGALNGIPEDELLKIGSDENENTGNWNTAEKDGQAKQALLLTKFWRVYDENGDSSIYCTQVCRGVTVNKEFDTKQQLYPIAIFQWDEREDCIYGHSEITSLIANQNAINRLSSVEIMSMLLTGVPKMAYNDEVITCAITNEPGQMIPISGMIGDVRQHITYLNPAQTSPNWDNVQQALIENTKIISGANQAGLGELRPENTSAIIALREAATLPLQPMLTRFYAFYEDIARICGDIILNKYGVHSLKMTKNGNTYYVPFNSEDYKHLMLSVRIDVGASTLWSVSTVISTLSNLLMQGNITILDYLERIPAGYILKKNELIKAVREREAQKAEMEKAALAAQTLPTASTEGAPSEAPPEEEIDVPGMLDELNDDEYQALKERPDILESVMGMPSEGG